MPRIKRGIQLTILEKFTLPIFNQMVGSLFACPSNDLLGESNLFSREIRHSAVTAIKHSRVQREQLAFEKIGQSVIPRGVHGNLAAFHVIHDILDMVVVILDAMGVLLDRKRIKFHFFDSSFLIMYSLYTYPPYLSRGFSKKIKIIF